MAVKQNELALEFVPNQIIELCTFAIFQNIEALKYVKIGVVLLGAVKHNGLVMQYIDNPSMKLCIEAVRQYGLASQYINNPIYRIMY